jgi:hypothetical protein
MQFKGAQAPRVSEVFNSCNGLIIFMRFLWEGTEIRAGIADLVINGSVHKQFDVVGWKRRLKSAAGSCV